MKFLLKKTRKTECGARMLLTRLVVRAAPFALLLIATGLAWAQQTLPTGWHVDPMGTVSQVDAFPMSTALSRDGKFLLVLSSGSIGIFDAASMKQTGKLGIGDAWLGLTFSPDGRFVYVGGGASYRVREFAWNAGELKPAREFEINPGAKPGERDFIGDVAVSPDGRLIYAADVYRDAVVVINPQSGRVIERFKSGRRPYRIVFHPDGKSYFVSCTADASVYQYDSGNGSEVGRVRVGPHPTDMVLSGRKPDRDADSGEKDTGARYRMFVAAGNTNNVFVVGVMENKDLKLLETLSVAMTPQQPAGMTPSGVALNAEQTALFVACTDGNAVAVADITQQRSQLAGFVPTGAYPNAMRVLADGRLVVVNGRESGALAVVSPLTEDALLVSTAKVLSLSGYKDSQLEPPTARPAVQNVVYVLREGGDGPNRRKLERDFVRFENYASLPGERWALAAISPDPLDRPFAVNPPPAGYLWSNATSAGLSVVTDTSVFMKTMESGGSAPRLAVIRLGRDDAALGSLVETVSKSAGWARTAIFVVEPTGLLALSPFTRRGATDSNPYNVLSALRTSELILGLRPMTVYDASARNLFSAFSPTPNMTPYTAEPSR